MIFNETELNETTYVKEGLSLSSHYDFRVKSYNSFASSEESVSYEFQLLEVPHAPTNLTEDFSARTETSIKLTWSEPDYFGGSDDVAYTVLQ